MFDAPITAADLRALKAIAARYATSPHEVDDLVQDVLLAAIRSGCTCGGVGFRPWAHGAIRNHSRFLARSAVRRRARETMHRDLFDPQGAPRMAIPTETVVALSPALKVVAFLVNLGMGKAEIAWLLGLSDQAARQRIHALRRPSFARAHNRNRWKKPARTIAHRDWPAGFSSGPSRHAANVASPFGTLTESEFSSRPLTFGAPTATRTCLPKAETGWGRHV